MTEFDLKSKVLRALQELGHGTQSAPDRQMHAEDEVANFEACFRQLGAWGRGRFVDEEVRDSLAVAGKPHVLRVGLRGLAGSSSHLVRAWLGERQIGEATVNPSGGCRIVWTPPLLPERASALYKITYEVFDDQSRCLRQKSETQPASVLVCDQAPVIAVGAEELFAGRRLRPCLQHLAALGCDLCYVDFDEADRARRMRWAIKARGLPLGPILTHPKEEIGFDFLNVDFREVIAIHALRSWTCQGVPMVGAVYDRSGQQTAQEIDGFFLGRPEEWLTVVSGSTRAAQIEACARQISEGRERAGWDDACFTLMADVEAKDGHRLCVEFDNRLARHRVFELLESAQQSIHLQFYILKQGRFADHLVVRLIERARAGVQVRLIVDALYSGHEVLGRTNPVTKPLLAEPNIEIRASDPITLRTELVASSLKQRDHRKLLVVDGRIAIISGRNGADEYYTGFDEIAVTDATPHDNVPWQDAHVEVEGPVVAEVEANFAANWMRNQGTTFNSVPVTDQVGQERVRMVYHDGLADTHAMAIYQTMIARAAARVVIVNDFPVTARLASELLDSVARGVRVQILTGSALTRRLDGTFLEGGTHRKLFEFMSKRRFEPLIRGGVELYELRTTPSRWVTTVGGSLRPYVHAKLVIADGKWASIGSANLDTTASYWERELNLLIEGEASVVPILAQVERMLEHSIRSDPDSEEWVRESKQRAVADSLWPDSVLS